VLPAIGGKQLGQVTRRDVQAIVDRMQAAGASASTVTNAIDPLRTHYRLAIEDDVVAVNPTQRLRLRKTDPKTLRVAEPHEAQALLDALPRIEDRALDGCALYAGLRRGELRGLRWSDVDRAAGEIHVRRGWDDVQGAQAPETRAGTRTGPDLPAAREAARGVATANGAPWRQPRVRSGRHDAVRAAVRPPAGAAGIRKAAGMEPIGLHECRHSFVSRAILEGVDKTGEEQARAVMSAAFAV
jgi:integrase